MIDTTKFLNKLINSIEITVTTDNHLYINKVFLIKRLPKTIIEDLLLEINSFFSKFNLTFHSFKNDHIFVGNAPGIAGPSHSKCPKDPLRVVW